MTRWRTLIRTPGTYQQGRWGLVDGDVLSPALSGGVQKYSETPSSSWRKMLCADVQKGRNASQATIAVDAHLTQCSEEGTNVKKCKGRRPLISGLICDRSHILSVIDLHIICN